MLNFFSKLRNKQVSLFMFNLILAIWLGAILNIGFFHSINLLTPYFGVKAVLFLAATVVIVVAAYYAILQILNWKWTAKVVAIILVIVGGFSAYFVNTLGIVISPDQIQNMVQTDAAEISDLISLRFGLCFPIARRRPGSNSSNCKWRPI